MSQHDITVKGGKSVRLPTAGKYCDRDIVVSAEGVDLPSLGNEGTASELMKNKELLNSKGEKVVGTFTLDSELITQDELIAEIKSVLQNKAAGGGTAPDPREQYQRVEYIESAEEGTYPYIITDFYADNSCGVEVVASFTKLQDRIVMGSREDSGQTLFYCAYPLSTSSSYYGFNSGKTMTASFAVNTIYRLQTNFLNSRLAVIYNQSGTQITNSSISATLATQTAPVAICGYNYAATGTVSSTREFKLYSARLSRGHEVVRNYYPCYRKSDGVVGVYETITNQFLTPETSAFAKGADIDWDAVI